MQMHFSILKGMQIGKRKLLRMRYEKVRLQEVEVLLHGG